MSTVTELIDEINRTRTQIASSAKDETKVMMAMLNDSEYKVDVYGKSGVEGSYCPYEESRNLIGNIIRDTTKISKQEAMVLSNEYEFGKQESNIMIGLSKEFMNTYLETGRKIALGGRHDSNISIAKISKSEKTGDFKRKIGVNDDGSDKFETVQKTIPAHAGLRVFSSCPEWLK